MTNEINNKDVRSRKEHLKFTCGWSSKELAWLGDYPRRLWAKEHNQEMAFREWMQKHLRNEFAAQNIQDEKFEDYIEKISRPIPLTSNFDGFLYDDDVIRLKSADSPSSVFLSALPKSVTKGGLFVLPVRATGSKSDKIMVRNAFHVQRSDQRIPSSVPLMFDECVYLCTETSTGQFLLHSEPRTYEKYAVLSGNQEVCWKSRLSGLSLWKIRLGNEQCDKRIRQKYIMVNTPVILTHVLTNQNLVLEDDFVINTIVGSEYEISAQALAPKGKSESKYLWILDAPYNVHSFPVDTK